MSIPTLLADYLAAKARGAGRDFIEEVGQLGPGANPSFFLSWV